MRSLFYFLGYRVGDMSFIRLNTGEKHFFGEPFVPNIIGIAEALSYINRFNGHQGQYSVAQHCVLVSRMLPDKHKLSGLLHDAPEAYLGDITSPLKALLPDYKAIEDQYHDVIDECFNVDTRCDAVREADLRMLITEVDAFNLDPEGFPDVEPFDIPVWGWSPDVACEEFLSEFRRLAV